MYWRGWTIFKKINLLKLINIKLEGLVGACGWPTHDCIYYIVQRVSLCPNASMSLYTQWIGNVWLFSFVQLHLSLYCVNSFRAQFFISISCRNLQYSSARTSNSLPKISKEASFNSTDCFSPQQALSSESSFSLKQDTTAKDCFETRISQSVEWNDMNNIGITGQNKESDEHKESCLIFLWADIESAVYVSNWISTISVL